MKRIKIGDTYEIENYGKPYYIAEMNSSHNGSLEVAKEMINQAKEIGCSCAKFQSWTPDTLYSQSYYKENPISKRIVQKFSFSKEQLKEIAGYCKEVGIDFTATPYSEEEVDFLVEECKVPFIKIASMEINNYPFLQYIGKKNIPIVLATGMADIDEIRKAVSSIEQTGNQKLCILHCVSVYPAPIEMINLRNVSMLQREFPDYVIGYSDHTIGSEAAMAAVALGAGVIEKHFTLDKTKIGMDNQMATEPNEMKEMIAECNRVYTIMGEETRIVSDLELEQRKKMRRSIVTAKAMQEGHVITAQDLKAKRPGTGFPPEYAEKLIGCVMKHDIEEDMILKQEDVISQA